MGHTHRYQIGLKKKKSINQVKSPSPESRTPNSVRIRQSGRTGIRGVTTNMAKVRKFEDGLKYSIWGKIVGLLVQDLDSMVKTAMTIEREVDDARSIWDAGAKDNRKESQPFSSSSGKKQRTSALQGFQGQGHSY